MKKNDVVQFNENHKWTGCLGIVTEVKKLSNGKCRYQIGIPVPNSDNKVYTAFIHDDGSGIERIGKAILTLPEKEN